jgi:hypothetical protein
VALMAGKRTYPEKFSFVKVRQPDMNRWLFLGEHGYLVSRRVHALMFTREEAERMAVVVRSGGDEAKVT